MKYIFGVLIIGVLAPFPAFSQTTTTQTSNHFYYLESESEVDSWYEWCAGGDSGAEPPYGVSYTVSKTDNSMTVTMSGCRQSCDTGAIKCQSIIVN